MSMLKKLLEKINEDPATDFSQSGRNPGSLESSTERINWALSILKDQNKSFQSLKEDLRLATEAVGKIMKTQSNSANGPQLFQLRSIEQNELAIVADSQNKAILVFTGVTIVFLPLSFFTGYYGMNLKGIQNTNKDEKWFWRVCGIVAFCIIGISMTYAFRHRLRRLGVFRRRAVEKFLP
jgi:Mg2+ and Co2+ transporter CorA